MNKACFFCTTPFQIITAIHLTIMLEKSSEVDLYVINQFKNAEAVTAKISETGMFHKVLLVKEEMVINKNNDFKLFIWSQILVSYLLINRRAKKILMGNDEVHYARMYISSKAFVSRLVALYYAKKEERTEIIYFDDGLGSYYNRNILMPRSSDKIFRKILFGKRTYDADPKKILLYSPELFYKADINVTENIDVKKIPKWGADPGLKDITNKIFSYSAKDSIEEPIIIFDNLYTGEKRKTIDTFYEQIATMAGARNVIIKKHPRDKGAGTKNLKYYDRPELPFELICQNTEMGGKLLIGVDTTAVVTPELLLDEEPFVLVLNKIPEFAASMDVNFCDFKELYKRPERFYEACSLDEAIGFIRQFCAP